MSFSFFLSCTQHVKNCKNRKPRKSVLKFSIWISELGLSAHICPTCRYVRPCISLNISNWPLKFCGHILEYIYVWFMGKFFFRFFGPYKAGPCLKECYYINDILFCCRNMPDENFDFHLGYTCFEIASSRWNHCTKLNASETGTLRIPQMETSRRILPCWFDVYVYLSYVYSTGYTYTVSETFRRPGAASIMGFLELLDRCSPLVRAVYTCYSLL